MTRRTTFVRAPVSAARAIGPAGVLVVSLLLMGCGSGGNAGSTGRGIVYGDVLAGPTCPVEEPGETECEDTPVAGSVEFWQGEQLRASATIHHDGAFTAEVPLGSYTVRVATGSAFPTCPEQTIEVTASAAVELHVACDTGIR